ncbi:MAG: alkylphosphonate utilization protein [Bdellovibrionaceae bacterium]|nr:alkylphosphonate utilization protein [Pseudobdellovibrionaceae bacterium]
MNDPENCPKCQNKDIYNDGVLWVCPQCSHEWLPEAESVDGLASAEEDSVIRDANGNILHDGDAVTVIKELKIKGSSSVVKVGTKVKNIRLVDASDGHDIACKIDGIGSINLKSEFVRKA